jgi:hypothetical protein
MSDDTDDEIIDGEMLQGELHRLHDAAREQEDRMRLLAKEHPALAAVFREVAGSVFPLLRDLCVATSQTATYAEEMAASSADFDGPENRLTREEGAKYVGVFKAVINLVTELESGAVEAQHKDSLAKLRSLVEDRVAFTESIMDDDDDVPTGDETDESTADA